MHLKRAIKLIGQSDLLERLPTKPRKYRKPRIKRNIDFGNLHRYDPRTLSYNAIEIFEGRVPEFEPYIMKDPQAAYIYARSIIKGRWPEAEPVIMKNPVIALQYARDVIDGRWPEAEPYLAQDPNIAAAYAFDVVRDPKLYEEMFGFLED